MDGGTWRVGQDLRTLWRTLEPRPLTRSPRLRRQHVLLTVAVELTHEIPYCLPNAMDVADPPAHFIYVWYRQYQIHFRRCSELSGGTPRSLRGGRRCKIPTRSCVFTTLAFPQIYIHFRWWTHDSDGRPLCKVLCVIKSRRGIVINDVSGRYHSSCNRSAG